MNCLRGLELGGLLVVGFGGFSFMFRSLWIKFLEGCCCCSRLFVSLSSFFFLGLFSFFLVWLFVVSFVKTAEEDDEEDVALDEDITPTVLDENEEDVEFSPPKFERLSKTSIANPLSFPENLASDSATALK